MIWLGFIYFIYGVVFGSFFNVVIYRIPNDMSIADGNSKCTSCNTAIRYRDLIPIVSYIYLRGKSSCCGQKISIIYPLVELVTGILFLLSFLLFGVGATSIFYIMLFSFLLIVGIIDWKYKLIYDSILVFFFIVGIIMKLFFLKGMLDSLIGAFVCYAVYYLVYFVVKLIYKEEMFGLGDVLFIGVIGFYLGTDYVFFTLFAPFYLALFFFVIAKYLFKKDIGMKLQVPFGPFISMSSILIVVITNLFF